MMVWTQSVTQPNHKLQLGEYTGAFMTLTFEATVPVGGVAGTTYDPTNHFTTSIEANEALFKNATTAAAAAAAGVQSLYELCGIRHVIQAICLGPGSSSTIRAAGATTFTGSCRPSFNENGGVFFILLVGGGNAGAGTDPLTPNDGTVEINNNAAALAPLSFSFLLIGR